MRRRVLLCLTLTTVSACNGDTVVQPTASPHSPTAAISDAVHGLAGNPDFFLLPPMVKDPSSDPAWDAGAFNANLRPAVEICASAATTESQVPTASCALQSTLSATVDAGTEQYHVNWQVPTSSTIFYRITVKVASRTLGFADVETGASSSALKNVATQEFIPLVDGRTLPIKFRIERYALCAVPGTGPCTSVSGDLSTAPIVVETGTPDGSGISTTTGVIIPQQTTPPGETPPPPVTVTLTSCTDLNPAVIDLPVFGSCTRVTTDPALPPLTTPATVFICSVGINASMFAGLSEAQEARVSLHRYDATGPNAGVAALPHAPACTPGAPGGIASIAPSVGGMLAHLARGQLTRAATEALALLAPKPLYAAMFIDLGGGGYTELFSDFQFALPAKMEIVPSSNNQVVSAGATLAPTVLVTDLGGAPVAGAIVHFNTSDPAVSSGTPVTTGADGLASAPWTVVTGATTFPASGRGIASPGNNGPRDGFDPFQPIQSHFDAGFSGLAQAVPVTTGSVLFSATLALPTGFETGDVAWSSTGSWHPSALQFSNTAYPTYVSLGTDDNSNGALPAPYAGTRSLWFGDDAYGNYAGELANTASGGTSTAIRVGTATSPEFLVPAGDGVRLSFRSWFEIESVNPSTFDLMDVSIQEAGAPAPLGLVRLNPATDPGGNSRTPLTSGGFNRAPVWQQSVVDLSAYRGKRVTLRFTFNTRDVLYNAFRGWIVDDVRILTGLSASAALIPLRQSFDVTPATDVPIRSWAP